MSETFAAARPHGAFEEVVSDIFLVTGKFTMLPLMTLTRNMLVLRHADELTLINSVRLSPDGERELEALGEVKHLIRLGAYHSVDDPYYVDRYRPTFYVSGRQRALSGLSPDVDLDDSPTLPFPGASIFHFQNTKYPESAIVLERDGGILLTCDCIGNVVNTDGHSTMAKVMIKLMGMRRKAGIPVPWRKGMKIGGTPLVDDFRRLLDEHSFQTLIGGHGPILREDVRQHIEASIVKAFGQKA